MQFPSYCLPCSRGKHQPHSESEPRAQPVTPPMDFKSEPTADPEPNPAESGQVREPASTSIPEGVLVEYEGIEWSPDHTV